jgi:hypothetical protein
VVVDVDVDVVVDLDVNGDGDVNAQDRNVERPSIVFRAAMTPRRGFAARQRG